MKTKQDFPSINERPPEGLKEDGSCYKILVVDDSMFVAKQLGQILTSEGYEIVATAVDGKDGVDKYKELCPHVDLVTMDITMPVMDGILAMKQILKENSQAKIVILSAMGQQENVKEALENGAKDFVVKPFKRERIEDVIKKVVKKLDKGYSSVVYLRCNN